MVTTAIAYILASVLLGGLGYWRVKLNKSRSDRQIESIWAELNCAEKLAFLATPEFNQGARHRATKFPKTIAWLDLGLFETNTNTRHLDTIFHDYLDEIKRSDPHASAEEWRDTLEIIISGLSSSKLSRPRSPESPL